MSQNERRLTVGRAWAGYSRVWARIVPYNLARARQINKQTLALLDRRQRKRG